MGAPIRPLTSEFVKTSDLLNRTGPSRGVVFSSAGVSDTRSGRILVGVSV